MSKYDATAFVGMAFGSETDEEFTQHCDRVWMAVRETCRECRVEACRVDEYAGAFPIVKEVKALIREADFCIFDLTGERPNVYYELGWADAAGVTSDEMILLARKGTRLHFDLQHRSVRFYSDADDIRKRLRADLRALLSGG